MSCQACTLRGVSGPLGRPKRGCWMAGEVPRVQGQGPEAPRTDCPGLSRPTLGPRDRCCMAGAGGTPSSLEGLKVLRETTRQAEPHRGAFCQVVPGPAACTV